MESLGVSAFVQMGVAVSAVIALILIASQLLKRLPVVKMGRHQDIKIEAAVSMGTRERLVIVKAADQRLLLGVTAHSITTLSRLEAHHEEELG